MPTTAYYQTMRDPAARREALRHLLAGPDGRLEVRGDPRWPDIGAPDFVVMRGAAPVGAVLIVTGGDAPADPRPAAYRPALDHLLVIDYTRFQYYQTGALKASAADAAGLDALLAQFWRGTPLAMAGPEALAGRLGALTRPLADLLAASDDLDLREARAALGRWLPPTPAPADFGAQMARLICHGLLLARLRHQGPGRSGPFRRDDAIWNIPATSPALRACFRALEGRLLDPRAAWLVDWMAALLAAADLPAILRELGRRPRHQDALDRYHDLFCEAFGGAADDRPHALPEQIAGFAARSVDYLLRKRLKYAPGLLDPRAVVLDPAAHTGTAFYFVIQAVHDRLRAAHQLGAWEGYAADVLLPRLIGVESSPAHYAAAHLKLNLQLLELRYPFASPQRLNLFLAALDNPAASGADTPFDALLAEESRAARAALADAPPRVVLGGLVGVEDARARLDHALQFIEGGCGALLLPLAVLDAPDYADLRRRMRALCADLYLLHLPDAVLILFDGRGGPARIHYHRVAEMGDWQGDDMTGLVWQTPRPIAPDDLLDAGATAGDLAVEYRRGWRIDRVLPVYLPGVAGDEALAFTRERAAFLAAQAGGRAFPLLYRPFDLRYIAAESNVHPALTHLGAGDNLGLCLSMEGSCVLVTRGAPAEGLLPGELRCFPLYIYPHPDENTADSAFAPGRAGRRPNLDYAAIIEIGRQLDLTFIPDGRGDLKATFGPEDAFNYLYALFHSRVYRTRYESLLRDGLPRAPLTTERRLFRVLARKGRALIKAHTLYHADGWPLLTGYAGAGEDRIGEDYPRFIELAGERGGRLYINREKYFEGVPRPLWEAEIGGVPVLRDWLTARRGLVLGWADLHHVQTIIVALARSGRIIDEIDDLVPAWPLA